MKITKNAWCQLLALVILLAAIWSLATTCHGQPNFHFAVIGDSPLAYYRLNDTPPPNVATNIGSLGTAGNGTYFGAGHRVPGVLVANPDAAASFDGTGVRVAVPFTSTLNPPAAKPFTVEAWVLPTIDGLGNAQAPLFNRHSPPSANRQGWVFFQRSSGTGFNFRMYNENGGTQSIDITGGPYTVGQWTHLAAVWNGSTATLYVNGVNVGSQTGGYVANTDAPFSIGAYGANNPGDNPFTGSIDEVAFYTNALTATQISNHYANALSPSPATPYTTLVLSDGAVEYLRLEEPTPLTNVAVNYGSLGPAGDGIHSPGAIHSVPGALAGVADTATRYSAIDTNSDDGGVPTIIPFNAALNPAGSFSVEAWLRPTEEGNGNAQSPMFNRDPNDANAPNRAGWDFFQRNSGTGWNFRMFNGNAHTRVFDITGGPYTVGAWSHLVAVYDATVPSATLYLNGVQVAQSTTPNGSFNPNTYAPLSVGGYSDGSQNPFVGDIDEVAIYTNVLTAAKVLAHYQNGTNAARAIPYNALVLADRAAEYLRFDEPARAIVANSGTLGSNANGTYVNTTNTLAGPQSPAYAGFESTNLAANFDGTFSYLELANPPGLNFTNTITLEAWVQPAATQPNLYADIIAHGADDAGSDEVVLRIDGSSGSYVVGTLNATASFAVPANDLGTTNWIHLAGTWDGTNWNLFRNGVLVASNPDPIGPSLVNNANWAIGARGKWKYALGYPSSGQVDVFSGGIDEAAIYKTALSPSRIGAHYYVGLYGANPLTITPSGANVTLSWPAGTLQAADTVTGPFSDVASAVSPYTVPVAGAAKKFYRIRFQ